MKYDKDGLAILKKPATKDMVKAFLVGMDKPAMVHKSHIGSKIPKQGGK